MASRERTAAARQRGDKTRTPTAAPPDAALGRLCEAQWLSVLAAEERDDVVGDAVAELLGAVVERCFQAELARQVGGARPGPCPVPALGCGCASSRCHGADVRPCARSACRSP